MAKEMAHLARDAGDDAAMGNVPTAVERPNTAPHYSYGTSINLESPELEKLGMHDGVPPVGSRVKIEALGQVTRAEHEAEPGSDKPRRRVGIQITHMAVAPAKKSAMADMYESSADNDEDDERK